MESDLASRLQPLNITFTKFQQDRIKSLVVIYSTAISRNIDNRFLKDSYKVFAALSIRSFDVDSFPAQSTPEFTVYGDNEIDLVTMK